MKAPDLQDIERGEADRDNRREDGNGERPIDMLF